MSTKCQHMYVNYKSETNSESNSTHFQCQLFMSSINARKIICGRASSRGADGVLGLNKSRENCNCNKI